MTHLTFRPAPRRGAVMMAVLVALGLASLLVVTAGWHFVSNRRRAEQREHQLQAAALARAGVELAVDRLLTDPDKYTGESAAPLPDSQVTVTVSREPGAPDTFRVVSEARYPTDSPRPVLRQLERRVHRHADGPRVRAEVSVPEPAKKTN